MDRENFTDIAGTLFEFVQREADRRFNVFRYRANVAPQMEVSDKL